MTGKQGQKCLKVFKKQILEQSEERKTREEHRRSFNKVNLTKTETEQTLC